MENKLFIIMISLISIILFSTFSIAMEYGTAEEAKAMLERAVKAVQNDKEAALKDFNNGSKMFKQNDLYVFCYDAETGEILANGANKSIVGKNVKHLKDKNGFRFGEEFFNNTENDEFREVIYWKPRPDETEASEKSSYITGVQGLGCGVGYYK